jgi:hypothetical protein
MKVDSYKKALADIHTELDALVAQRNELDKRIAKLRQSATSLQSLIEDEVDGGPSEFMRELAEIGLTDACREVLKATGEWMLATVIRDSLSTVGYDTTGQKNPLSSIHNILKRLVDSGEVVEGILSGSDKTVYKWIGTSPFKRDVERGEIPRVPRLPTIKFSDAVRKVLQDAKEWQYTSEIKDSLQRMGFNILTRPELYSDLNEILDEFVASGEVQCYPIREGQASYRWINPEFKRLADTFLEILKNAKGEMTPTEIAEAFKRFGFNVKTGSDFVPSLDALRVGLDVMKRTDKHDNVTYRLMTEEEKKKRDAVLAERRDITMKAKNK